MLILLVFFIYSLSCLIIEFGSNLLDTFSINIFSCFMIKTGTLILLFLLKTFLVWPSSLDRTFLTLALVTCFHVSWSRLKPWFCLSFLLTSFLVWSSSLDRTFLTLFLKISFLISWSTIARWFYLWILLTVRSLSLGRTFLTLSIVTFFLLHDQDWQVDFTCLYCWFFFLFVHQASTSYLHGLFRWIDTKLPFPFTSNHCISLNFFHY